MEATLRLQKIEGEFWLTIPEHICTAEGIDDGDMIKLTIKKRAK